MHSQREHLHWVGFRQSAQGLGDQQQGGEGRTGGATEKGTGEGGGEGEAYKKQKACTSCGVPMLTALICNV